MFKELLKEILKEELLGKQSNEVKSELGTKIVILQRGWIAVGELLKASARLL